MSECSHDLVERETACVDGVCPICLRAEVEWLKKRQVKPGWVQASEAAWKEICDRAVTAEARVAELQEKVERLESLERRIKDAMPEVYDLMSGAWDIRALTDAKAVADELEQALKGNQDER